MDIYSLLSQNPMIVNYQGLIQLAEVLSSVNWEGVIVPSQSCPIAQAQSQIEPGSSPCPGPVLALLEPTL